MKKIIFIHILNFFILSGMGQTRSLPQDTTRKTLTSFLNSYIKKEVEKTTEQFNEDKISLNQEHSLEKILQYTRSAKEYLKSGIDTTELQSELADIKVKYLISEDGIFTNIGAIQTHRNLTTTSKILTELLNELNSKKEKIDIYKRKLVGFKNDIDSLSSVPVLFIISKDSAQFVRYLEMLEATAKEVHPVENTLKHYINSLKNIKDQIDYVVFDIRTALDRIEQDEIILSNKSLAQEVGYLWQPPIHHRPLGEILFLSMQKGALTLNYYVSNTIGRILMLMLLIVLSAFFITSLKKKAQSEQLIRTDFSGQLVIRYPVLSAMLIVISIFQFIFPNPPFIFNCLLWIVSITCLTIIFMNYISRYWMWFWILMCTLFLLACGNNLILQASRIERWIMLFIASAGLFVGVLVLSKKRREQLREKSIIYFIVFIIIIEMLSIVANVYGRFNFSKSLLTSGFINLIIAITFLWTVRLINEGLTLASQMFKTPERRLFYINFGVIGNKAPLFLYLFLVIGWFIVFARNFYEFHFITKPVTDLIYGDFYLGDYHFSVYTITLFLIILILATLISKIISFFEDDGLASSTYNNKKRALGSWILLIRIFIVVVGLVLSFAAIGIPLDKATFVLGALGVGVGFGLQSLVQNLVSGVIMTFEKPVNVGDFVEIKGQTGTIKSIGFRSSVLVTLEGSNVIIPNGEILNESVTNWTHERGMNRRTEIIVGVAYGTDLELAKKILIDLATAHENILNNPPPFVLITDFDSSSIRLQVFFWTSTPMAGKFVKSELIIAIQTAFKNNNIIIPFPQQDVYIKTIPSSDTSND